MDDSRPDRSLADDPGFLASLEGLDKGLDGASLASARENGPPAEAVSREPPIAEGREHDAPLTLPPPASDRPQVPAAERPQRESVLALFPPVELKPAPRGRDEAHPQTTASPAPKAHVTFYSLQEDPFSPTPDPRFFYHSSAHDDAVQELLTAIRRREGVVLVTGVDGAGKTALCHTVVEHLDRRTLTCFVPALLTFDDLVKAALIGFGVITPEELERRPPGAAELLVTFREFLLSLSGLQAFAVLFLDDAGEIKPSVLRQVATLADTGADQRLLEVVLVGDERLVKTLGRADLKPLASQITRRCTVGVLMADEVPGYVTHRLTAATPNPRIEFGDDAFERLAELSAGVPRIVNVLCNRALETAAASGAPAIDAADIDAAAAALDIAPPETAVVRALRSSAIAIVLLALMAVGAGVAALMFQDRLGAAMHAWQQTPSAPRAPLLPTPQPIVPVPPPTLLEVAR